MMGLSPLQRDLRENDIRFRDYRKDSVFGPSTSLPADASGYTAQVAGTSPSLDIMKSNIAASLAKGQPDYMRTAAEHYVLGAAMMPQPMPAGATAAGHVGGYTALWPAAPCPRPRPGISIRPRAFRGVRSSTNIRQRSSGSPTSNWQSSNSYSKRSGAWAKSTDQLNKAIAVQESWNRLGLTDADKATLGPTRMADLAASVNQNADTTVSQQA
jgi:hypothetical protein